MPALESSLVRDDVQAFLAYVRLERELVENTALAYGRDLRRFSDWVEGGAITDYLNSGPDDLGRFPGYLKGQQLGDTSIARHVATIKSFYKYLVLEQRTLNVLSEFLESPAVWRRLPQYFTPAAARKLLSARSRLIRSTCATELSWKRSTPPGCVSPSCALSTWPT